MRREYIAPLVVGILAGVVVMFFVQFSINLAQQKNRLDQIEVAVGNNGKAISEVVAFIQKAQGGNQAPAAQAPAATEIK
ncbi:MAG: hypothetical protein ACOYMB_01075 [Patescibacteria group bacterium]